MPYLGALGPGEAVNARGYFVRRRNRTVYPTVDRSILVRVTTRDGAVGWGETYGLIAPRATIEILFDLYVPFALGRDPADPAALHDDLFALQRVRNANGGFAGDALAALDIAVWDVAARRRGVPLAALLGGARRQRIEGYVSGLPRPTLAERVAFAAEWAARGFDAFKFAAAVSEAGEEAELAALRMRLGPAARIGIDLHWRYTPDEALALIDRLAPLDPFFVEAPVAGDDIAGLVRVARSSPVPVAAGEEWYAAPEAAARLPGLKVVQPEIGHAGVTEFLRIAGAGRGQRRTGDAARDSGAGRVPGGQPARLGRARVRHSARVPAQHLRPQRAVPRGWTGDGRDRLCAAGRPRPRRDAGRSPLAACRGPGRRPRMNFRP